MPKCYQYRAHNDESFYGWTEDPAIATAALGWLNKGREVGLYTVELVEEGHGDLIFDNDTTLDDFGDPV